MIEANTFAPGETTLDDFRAQVWAVGDEVRRDTLGLRSELAVRGACSSRPVVSSYPGSQHGRL